PDDDDRARERERPRGAAAIARAATAATAAAGDQAVALARLPGLARGAVGALALDADEAGLRAVHAAARRQAQPAGARLRVRARVADAQRRRVPEALAVAALLAHRARRRVGAGRALGDRDLGGAALIEVVARARLDVDDAVGHLGGRRDHERRAVHWR